VKVRTFESDCATINRYAFAPGATFPGHFHAQEQVTLVEAGEVAFTTPAGETTLRSGDWQIVAPGVPHRVTAGPEGASVTAVLVPRRGSEPITMEEPARSA
jgi:quercetin dioxygenase-like cupin family protein